MNIVDVEVITVRVRNYGSNDNTEMGYMYDLHRNEESKNDLRITDKFGIG